MENAAVPRKRKLTLQTLGGEAKKEKGNFSSQDVAGGLICSNLTNLASVRFASAQGDGKSYTCDGHKQSLEIPHICTPPCLRCASSPGRYSSLRWDRQHGGDLWENNLLKSSFDMRSRLLQMFYQSVGVLKHYSLLWCAAEVASRPGRPTDSTHEWRRMLLGRKKKTTLTQHDHLRPLIGLRLFNTEDAKCPRNWCVHFWTLSPELPHPPLFKNHIETMKNCPKQLELFFFSTS